MFNRFKTRENGTNTIVEGKCVVTGKPVRIVVPTSELKAYFEDGVYAQDAFKSITKEEREYFISGYSSEAFDAATKEQ